MTADLHCHTKLSDGSMGIDDIIILAQKRGVDTLAITDRDCLAGTVRAKLIGERHGIKVIPGVELSSYDSENKSEVYIIGYLSDSPDRLEGLCHRNLIARKRAAQYMMIKAAQKFPISADLVLKCAQGSTNVYPVHIMSALMESGMTTELYGELYNSLFTEGGEQSILVRPKLSEPEEVIEAIHDAGGIAILAYAGTFDGTNVIEKLVAAGLDGIEVWCPQHDEETAERLAKFAKKNGLLAVGGSDFKGRNNNYCVTLGSYTTPESNYSEFNNYKAKIRRQQKKNAAEEK
ncbi:MAG: PHP domain-containing protein [Clostridia bacterium]|nr:PHP domain-containing protein [Clostridia bacterium]